MFQVCFLTLLASSSAAPGNDDTKFRAQHLTLDAEPYRPRPTDHRSQSIFRQKYPSTTASTSHPRVNALSPSDGGKSLGTESEVSSLSDDWNRNLDSELNTEDWPIEGGEQERIPVLEKWFDYVLKKVSSVFDCVREGDCDDEEK
jgi:hypothetical protein